MKNLVFCIIAALSAAIGTNETGFGAAPQGAAAPSRRELIYGAELMTHEEREQYRARMRGAQAPAEGQRLRAEHRAAIQQRARERGVRVFEPPPAGGAK